ncbi:MAG TPA: bile acid:sodium symporter family protein [Marinospirillum sp.]|uniref:bile acid:sodium symporter family protein n=1 Tax=Marinospirillum sp. TaxID=2183934 RepID=UPI002B46D59F|nr:bile acid:sodium symporter family protein [Marinospirillum sp.]HKM16304.1 bile acid:sodium symporter family protein [Marinospirillum sp.]
MTMLANQILLPLCLALIMLVMGTGLSLQSFLPVLHKPKAVLLGIVAQLVLLPMIVWVLILALHLPPVIAAGLVLIACAPGGATSNLFSKLADGDLPLSIALTAVISLLSPLWMPWAAQTQLGWLGYDVAFKLSYVQVVLQLLLVTALPLVLGMGLRKLYPSWVQTNEQRLKQVSIGLLMLMILVLIVVNAHVLPSVFGLSALMVVLLATLALALGYGLARLVGLSQAQSRTLSFETGVQNAGMAIMIAFSFLQAPELGMVALLYGILMNIPAFITLWAFKRGSLSLKNKQQRSCS